MSESSQNFLDKYKIKKIYSYTETKKGSTVTFGWSEATSVGGDSSFLLSYPSKTKKTKDEKAWSDAEGRTVISVPDCRRFFSASTGYSPEEFLELSDDILNTFADEWLSDNNHHDEDTYLFISLLSELISTGKSFNMGGRGYKIISI